ncbi:MAG: hypothetical protein KC441_08770 [Anaerolineales bacterium]|nr:hypothetical protein [Anaerolineales bacterium]MCB8987280.1 hypothetical protein [Ardenticatenaceae bacterium]
MKRGRGSLVWGVALILLGVVFLLQTLGFITEFAPLVWGLIFAGASLLFLVTYLVSGWHEWGWLFPTSIFAGLAAVVFLSESGADGTWLGALIMGAVALPFWLAFVIDRRGNWWALIPGWVLTAITAVILLSDTVSGELIGSFVMFSIGLPFLVVFLLNRSNWWALIPAGVLCGLGLILLFVNQTSGTWMGFLILLIMSLPFLFVYLRVPKQWWAIIPGGILLVLAVVTLLAGMVEPQGWGARLLSLLTLWGISAPFIFLWRQREVYPTEWAKYPAGALLLLGAIAPFVQQVPGNALAIILILVGGWMLFSAARKPKSLGE